MHLNRPLTIVAAAGCVLFVLMIASQLWLVREVMSLRGRVAVAEQQAADAAQRAAEAERRVDVLAGNAGQLAGFLSEQLTALVGQPIALTVPIKQELPINTTIPFKEEITVPINLSIPVNTTVNVPLDLGPLGTIPLNFPINLTVPVNTSVTVPLNESVSVQTVVPIDMQIPVNFSLAEGPMGERLAEWQSWLQLVAEQMPAPQR